MENDIVEDWSVPSETFLVQQAFPFTQDLGNLYKSTEAEKPLLLLYVSRKSLFYTLVATDQMSLPTLVLQGNLRREFATECCTLRIRQ